METCLIQVDFLFDFDMERPTTICSSTSTSTSVNRSKKPASPARALMPQSTSVHTTDVSPRDEFNTGGSQRSLGLRSLLLQRTLS